MPSHRPGARTPQWPVGYFLRREGLPALPAPAVVTPTVVGAGLVMCASAGLVTVVLTGQQQQSPGRTAASDPLMTGSAEPSDVSRTAGRGLTSAPETAAAPVAPPTVLAQPTPGWSGYSDAGGARRGGVPGSRDDGGLPEAWRGPTAVDPVPVLSPAPVLPPAPGSRRPVAADGAGRPTVDGGSGRPQADLGVRVEPGTVQRDGTDSRSGESDRADGESGGRDADGVASERGSSARRTSDSARSERAGDREELAERGSDERDSGKRNSAKKKVADQKKGSDKDSDEKEESEKDSREEKDSDGKASDKKDSDKASDKKASDKKASDKKASDKKDSSKEDSGSEDESDEKDKKGDDSKGSDKDDREKPRSDRRDDDRRADDHRADGDSAGDSAGDDVSIEPVGTGRDGVVQAVALSVHRRLEPGFSWFTEPSPSRRTPALVRTGAHARPAHAAPDGWSPDFAVLLGRAHHRPAHAIAS